MMNWAAIILLCLASFLTTMTIRDIQYRIRRLERDRE